MKKKSLLIFPTIKEAEHIFQLQFRTDKPTEIDQNTDVFISGPGTAASILNLSSLFGVNKKWDKIILNGIAGSYKPDIPPGEIVCVISECIADLGYCENNRFTALYKNPEFKEYYMNGKIQNPHKDLIKQTGLQTVESNTVNLNNPSLEGMNEADIENMEGAGFFLTAIRYNIPFLEIRAISNFVNDRNKSNWEINNSLNQLKRYLFNYLKL